MVSGSDNADNFDHVKAYFDRPSFFMSGLDLRVFSLMGDRVAAAILRILPLDRRVNDQQLTKILAAVHASLEYPEDVDSELDRHPDSTLSLLEELAGAAVGEQKDRIRSAIEAIRTCAK